MAAAETVKMPKAKAPAKPKPVKIWIIDYDGCEEHGAYTDKALADHVMAVLSGGDPVYTDFSMREFTLYKGAPTFLYEISVGLKAPESELDDDYNWTIGVHDGSKIENPLVVTTYDITGKGTDQAKVKAAVLKELRRIQKEAPDAEKAHRNSTKSHNPSTCKYCK